MSRIVEGNFAHKAQADSAIEGLLRGGIARDRICAFTLNPPGQHAAYPIGGDEFASAGATEAGGGALKGAAMGGIIGLGAGVAALPVAGPAGLAAGAGIGAYIGSLAGALNSMEDTPVAEDGAAPRPAGVLVAVGSPKADERAFASYLLQQRGARDVQETEGTWRDGEWVDFDPVPEHSMAQQSER